MIRFASRIRAAAIAAALAAAAGNAVVAAPILFATVTPSSDSTFGHMVSLVASHQAGIAVAPRGGDLYVRYDDGSLRNLTAEAGYGDDIVVREISVHWSGQKALFAMAVGGTGANPTPVFFQIYEVSGFHQGQTVQITKLNQPGASNNIQPCYASNDDIIFVSDLPPTLNPLHYPPLDEYESTPTVAGMWKMKPDGTGLTLLDNNPSGDFTPFVDSYGRIVFTRWDHLKRDQQWDLWVDEQLYAAANPGFTPSRSKPLTYDSETDTTPDDPAYGQEYFPENGRLHPDVAGSSNPGKVPHPYWDQDFVPGTEKQDFNFFTPWMIMQDGTEGELLNHLGRHEMFNYVERARVDLPHFHTGKPYTFTNCHQMREDPSLPGRYYGMDGAEFGYHGAGRIFRFDAQPNVNADDIPPTIKAITPNESSRWAGNVQNDLYRDLMIRADGTMWVSAAGTAAAANRTVNNPSSGDYVLSSNYQFVIRQLQPNGKGYHEATGPELIPGGITATVSYVSNTFWPPRTVTYTGRMWELYAVEAVARTAPSPFHVPLPSIEENMLNAQLGGPSGVEALREWMRDNDLALVVARDVTVRADKQQAYNLKVSWSNHVNAGVGETPEEVGYLQFLNGQYVRSMQGRPGRRQLARFIENLPGPAQSPAAPVASVRIGDDGSAAAFVPAGRATTWQLTDASGNPVVRERYWLTFQAGEIRACTNCHGVNKTDVFNKPAPTNEPQALTAILNWWQASQNPSRIGDWSEFTSVFDNKD